MQAWCRPLSSAIFITSCQTLQLSRCGSGFPGYHITSAIQEHAKEMPYDGTPDKNKKMGLGYYTVAACYY